MIKPDPTITLDMVKIVLFANDVARRECYDIQQTPDDFSPDDWAQIVHDFASGKEKWEECK